MVKPPPGAIRTSKSGTSGAAGSSLALKAAGPGGVRRGSGKANEQSPVMVLPSPMSVVARSWYVPGARPAVSK
ncbi:MAG TPA: hypothetical protein DGT21_14715 [Armatimonadetes bacterium]|nr:hypothetical protein [Armatimonadota bacterium]